MRIVSLLPSATEILCALGLEDQLVGISHGCDYPDSIVHLPRVTSTVIPKDASSGAVDRLVREQHRAGLPLYQLDEALLSRLAPDLLVTQGLCDVCAVPDAEATRVAGRLAGRAELELVSLAPTRLEDVFRDVVELGARTGTRERAEALVRGLRARLESVREATAALPHPRVSLVEWADPLYACGHWTPDLVALAGGVEGHARPGDRSRRLDWAEVLAWQPEALVLAACGKSLEDSRLELPRLAALPGFAELPCARAGRVFAVDGQAYFSRPGPRLIDSLELLAWLFHPERCSFADGRFSAATLASFTP
jgi:iron complex transport system substrate-binding protein